MLFFYLSALVVIVAAFAVMITKDFNYIVAGLLAGIWIIMAVQYARSVDKNV